MIIVHEYPFRMVEHPLFILLLKTLNPRYEPLKRQSVKNDVMKVFAIEKEKLKVAFSSIDRFSLTADLWTSNQTIGYMCLTGHYLDSEWTLQKRILSFYCLPPPHTGVAIADSIFKCLIDWGIENKVSTITLDNASANDVAVRNLKDYFSVKGSLFFGGKIFHVRCCAHVLNLMVQDGLSEIRDVVENVRETVKYIKMSPSRLHKFMEIVKQLQLSTSKRLILDVPTRWNSTYAMLESAIEFKQVFPRYKERDPNYKWLPSDDDWSRAEEVCKFLEIFNEATNAFSGCSYPTSNLFLAEIWKIKEILNAVCLDTRDYMIRMSEKMNEKFDKYWGECNLLMAIAAVLDPRYKMMLIEFCFPKIYSTSEARVQIDLVRHHLHELYKDYASKDVASSSGNIPSVPPFAKGKTKSRNEFDLWVKQLDVVQPMKSELDVYLEEGIYLPEDDVNNEFDALVWWKANTLKFRNLSKMARDILSVPATTVASESAFSAGGRVLD
ncbi:hypothetical protein QJS10_CPA08g01608 [Acorus calamus]|uniref:Zinc finger BED domain-containing protein RICESLEEPER 2-like n=1 Tax=Acorus calamus TaxID=4465 RepID=A0AAV9EBD2_ACOCL|nr:hypothetical protein QJS10_CPA08g01608 [Acorus calamus]